MNPKRFTHILIIFSMLACNYINDLVAPPTGTPLPVPTATVVPTSTPGPLTPAYIPPNCQNIPLATVPPATALAQPTPSILTNPEIIKDIQREVFNNMVGIIGDVYVYPDFNGKDWRAIVAKYRIQMEEGLSTEEFYAAMQAMIEELGDEHSSFESPADVAQSEADLAGNNDYVGVGVYILPQLEKKQAVVISVFPDSPAQFSGLKPHDAILAVDGLPIMTEEQSYIYLARGPECSATVLTVRSPGEDARDVMIVRQRIRSPLVIDAWLIPTLDGSRIGYIFLPTFFDQTIPGQVEEALRSFGPLDGLILDNRLNGGGSSDVVEPIMAFFESGTLGEFVSRDGRRPFRIRANPIENSQDVPLVILVSEETASFGEIFSGVLRDSGRAKIAGQTSLGNVEILNGYDLPDGSRLWIAAETFASAFSDTDWEQTGIIPDLEAIAGWDEFTFETDPAIPAALSLLGHK